MKVLLAVRQEPLGPLDILAYNKPHTSIASQRFCFSDLTSIVSYANSCIFWHVFCVFTQMPSF